MNTLRKLFQTVYYDDVLRILYSVTHVGDRIPRESTLFIYLTGGEICTMNLSLPEALYLY